MTLLWLFQRACGHCKARADPAEAERRRRAEEERRLAEEQRLAEERRAAEEERRRGPARAREVADGAWAGLEQLVQCAALVCTARGTSDNTSARVLSKVAAFDALRGLLQDALSGSDNPVASVATVSEVCDRAEKQIEQSRDATLTKQRELRKAAQERDEGKLENLIQNRDLQRTHLAQVLVSGLSSLLEAAEEVVPPGVARLNSVKDAVKQRRRRELVSIAKPSVEAWKRAAEGDVERLQDALRAASDCVAEYAVAHGGAKAIGSSEIEHPEAAAEGAATMARAALQAYSDWKGRVGADVAAGRTDEALGKMQDQMLGSFKGLFLFSSTSEGTRAKHEKAIKNAMLQCGAMVQAEHEAQAKDFLADMPCHLLISAGRRLMEERSSHCAAMARVHAVVCEITRELDMMDSVLESTGMLAKMLCLRRSLRAPRAHGLSVC